MMGTDIISPRPHRWYMEYVVTDEGSKPHTRCAFCGVSKLVWEAKGSPVSPDEEAA
jgi:hypothetical protein